MDMGVGVSYMFVYVYPDSTQLVTRDQISWKPRGTKAGAGHKPVTEVVTVDDYHE